MNDVFWVCWNPSHSNPRKKHPTLNKAVEEAKRLAENDPNASRFYVLECVGYAERQPMPVVFVGKTTSQ